MRTMRYTLRHTFLDESVSLLNEENIWKRRMRGSSNGKLEYREALLPFPKFHFQYKIITKLISVCRLTQTRCIIFEPMTPISSLCYALFRLYSNWKTSKTYAMHTLDGPQWYNKIGISFYLSIYWLYVPVFVVFNCERKYS